MNLSIPTALQGGGAYPSSEPAAVPVPKQDAAAVAVAVAQAVAPKPVADVAQVERALQKIKAAVQPMAQNLQFSMDESSGKSVVRVVDTTTHEVIRQIPSEEVLKMAQELDRMQGLLLRGKA